MDISKGKIDLNRTSSAKIIELFHFVLPAGTMKKWTVPGEGHIVFIVSIL